MPADKFIVDICNSKDFTYCQKLIGIWLRSIGIRGADLTGLSVNTISSAENCGDFKVSTLLLMVNAFREKLGEEIEWEKIGAYILYGKNEEKTNRVEQKKTNLERFVEFPVELQDKLLAVVETMNSLK